MRRGRKKVPKIWKGLVALSKHKKYRTDVRSIAGGRVGRQTLRQKELGLIGDDLQKKKKKKIFRVVRIINLSLGPWRAQTRGV